MAAYVSGLAATAVKSMRLSAVQRIELGRLGAVGNRAFCIIDGRGRLVNSKRLGSLQTICSSHDPAEGTLALTFPDGSRVDGVVERGESLPIRFFSDQCEARAVVG